jgi:hypothetical protein
VLAAMSGRDDPTLDETVDTGPDGPYEAALAFFREVVSDSFEHGCLSRRRVLDGGDEIIVLVPPENVIATQASGFRFLVWDAIFVRLRREPDGWRVLGFSDDLADLVEEATA